MDNLGNNYLTLIAIAIRVFAAIMFTLYVLPIMLRESKLEGSLKKFRQGLVVLGMAYLTTIIGTTTLQMCRMIQCFHDQLFIDELAIINSLGFLVTSVAWVIIYRRRPK